MIKPEGAPWHAKRPSEPSSAADVMLSHAKTLRSLRRISGPSAVGEYLATLEANHGADFARLAHEASVS
jgi:hypothetical protein